MPATPSYARRRLGTALKARRTQTGLSIEEVGDHFGWDKSKISRIENGKVGLSRHDLVKLANHYGVEEADLQRLERWMLDSRGVRWWAEFGDVLTSDYEELISLESQASNITMASSALVPGLLQSPGYAAATVALSPFVPDPDNAEVLAQVRARRQGILTDEDGVELVALLGAATLYAELGGRAALVQQLAHLIDMGRLPNVTVQVLPFTAPAGNCLGNVTLLDFAELRDPSVVHIEYQAGALFRDSERDVRRYRRNLDALRSQALSPGDSLKLITSRLEELESL